MAHRADQRGGHPALARRRRCWSCTGEEPPSTRWCSPGWSSRSGVVVDDAIIDIENIVRRLRGSARAMPNRPATQSVVLEASLEVRSAIVYATLHRRRRRRCPVFFLDGLTGAFFRPLATAYALAVLVSHGGGADRHAGDGPASCCRNAPLERRESPLVRVLQRGYDALLTAWCAGPGPRVHRRGAIAACRARGLPHAGPGAAPGLQGARLPDALGDQAGHVAPGGGRASPSAASKELRAIPGVRNFGAHIGQALLADEVVGADFGENWISVDPDADYDATVASDPGRRRWVPRPSPGRADLPQGADPGGADRRGRGHRGPHLRAGPQGAAEKADEIPRSWAGSTASSTSTSSSRRTSPRSRSGRPGEGQKYGIKPGDVRRAAATMLAGEEVGDIFRGGKAYDVQVWSVPAARHSLSDIQNLQLDTPDGGHVRWRMSPTCRSRHTERIDTRTCRGGSTSAPTSTDRDLGAVVAEVETPSRRDRHSPRVPRRGARRVPGAPGAPRPACWAGARWPRSRSSCCCSSPSGNWAGGAGLPDAALGAGRRGPGGLAQRRHHLARLPGRVLHRARHRGPQRHHADQPLPAPRARGRRAVRPGAGHPGRPGAAGAHPDDRAGDRLWPWCR